MKRDIRLIVSSFLLCTYFIAGFALVLSPMILFAGCLTADQIQQGSLIANKINADVKLLAQSRVDAMPATTPAQIVAKADAQAKVNAAASTRDLYLFLGEDVATLLVKPDAAPVVVAPATQPAK